ncbi:hypothetical protein PERMA_1710 [Persephonella marina EX-H1]|uniref:Uncharacterized protein n=1 Tax=Persephonella marina (strain DSM 14350 / EX-H1) TaxID=123214 RepID=C0QS29_PERMH|nr:hypothetical protein PERMA_1710 [Persephonella marina EX-H1]
MIYLIYGRIRLLTNVKSHITSHTVIAIGMNTKSPVMNISLIFKTVHCLFHLPINFYHSL